MKINRLSLSLLVILLALFFLPAVLFSATASAQLKTDGKSETERVTTATIADPVLARSTLAFTDKEKDWLAEHKTISVAFDGHFPPYSFFNVNGQLEGLAVDVMQLLADRIGVTFTPFPLSVWKDLYRSAQQHKVDMVATMGDRPEREEWFVFTRPYIFKSLVIMTEKKTNNINSSANLVNKKVALVKSYQYVKPLLEKYPSIRPFYVDTMLDGLNAVSVGQADAAIIFAGAGHYLKTKYQLSNLKFAAVLGMDPFTESIGIRNDWPELAGILNKALDSIDDKEMQVLRERWIGPEIVPGIAPRLFFIYLAAIGGVVLLFFSGFMVWNRSLRLQVSKKTEELQQELGERKRIEVALRKSRESLKKAQQIAQIGNWDLDLVTNQLDWSDEVYRIFDLKPQQFEATYGAFLDNIHPDDRELVNSAYTESVKNKTPYSIVHRLLKNGSIKYVNERCETFYDENDKPVRSVGTIQDITRLKQAEELLRQSEERFRAIFNAANDAFFIHDLETGKILDVNQKMCEMFGVSREEALAADVSTFSSGVPPYSQEDALGWLQRAAAGEPQLFTWRSKNKAGNLFWTEVNMRRAPIGSVDRIVVTVRDITERKQNEELLLKYQTELEALVKEQTQELETKVAELERMNKLFVGREFRIKELRDKITELEKY